MTAAAMLSKMQKLFLFYASSRRKVNKMPSPPATHSASGLSLNNPSTSDSALINMLKNTCGSSSSFLKKL